MFIMLTKLKSVIDTVGMNWYLKIGNEWKDLTESDQKVILTYVYMYIIFLEKGLVHGVVNFVYRDQLLCRDFLGWWWMYCIQIDKT